MEIIRDVQDDIVILRLQGRLDGLTSQDLDEELKEQINSGCTKFILDLSKLDYISSSGLRVLLVGQKQVQPARGSLLLLNVNEQIKEVFEISGFTSLFKFFDDETAAKQGFEALQ